MKILICVLLLLKLLLSQTLSDDILRETSLNGGYTDIIVVMKNQIDVEKINLQKLDNIQIGRKIFNTLYETSKISQKNIQNFLNKKKLEYRTLWIQNSVSIKNIHIDTIQEILKRDDVLNIFYDQPVEPIIEKPHDDFIVPMAKNFEPEWNLVHTKVPEVWRKGFTGKGMVLANSDTGALWNHEALIKSYRGTKGFDKNGKVEVDHNYNWYCPSTNRTEPFDTNGHGTHTVGTIAGGKEGKKIGMAPDAKWIHCRGLAGGVSNLIACNQFFLAPHKLDGSSPNPDLRPHATSHSYFCSGNCGQLMAPSITALRKAGVFFIKSAGNQGPRCSTITQPGFEKGVVAIGALQTKSDLIASFSSKGPIANMTKPDFSAPGQGVNSAWIGGRSAYRAASGTSMAAPGFNGAVGLLWSAVKELERDLDKTEEIFRLSSLKQRSTECQSNGSPNNVFGYGTINVLKAIELAQKLYQNKK